LYPGESCCNCGKLSVFIIQVNPNSINMEERFPDNVAQQGPTRAVRLIFEYEGDEVRLIIQTPVDMAPAVTDLAHPEHAAYYVDTRDAADRTLARVSAHGAFASSTEVFPEQPGDPITRVDMDRPKGAFTVIAPAPDDTDHVTVLKIAKRAAPKTGAAEGISPELAAPEIKDLASFPISIESSPKQEGGPQ
jgi:hypothetical protein